MKITFCQHLLTGILKLFLVTISKLGWYNATTFVELGCSQSKTS
jgi:hypothetical protein